MNLGSLQLIAYISKQRNEHKIDSSHIRKFILSSYRVFSNLNIDILENTQQFLNIESEQQLLHNDQIYTKYSILYRDVLRHLLSDIDQVAEQLNLLINSQIEQMESSATYPDKLDNGNNEEINECIQFYDMVKSIEKTWYLCEILFLNGSSDAASSNGSMKSLDLVRWLKGEHEPLYLPQRVDDLLEHAASCQSTSTNTSASASAMKGVGTGAEYHIDYYSLLYDLVLHGKLETLYHLLTLHSRFSKFLQLYPQLGNELKRLLCEHPYAFYIDLDMEGDELISTFITPTSDHDNDNGNDNFNTTSFTSGQKKNNDDTNTSHSSRLSFASPNSRYPQTRSNVFTTPGTTAAASASASVRGSATAFFSPDSYEQNSSAHKSNATANITKQKLRRLKSIISNAEMTVISLKWREQLYKLYQRIMIACQSSALVISEVFLILEVLCGQSDDALQQLIDHTSAASSALSNMSDSHNSSGGSGSGKENVDKAMKLLILQLLYKYPPPVSSQDLLYLVNQTFSQCRTSTSASPLAESTEDGNTSYMLLCAGLNYDAGKIMKYIYELMIAFQQQHQHQYYSQAANHSSVSISSSSSVSSRIATSVTHISIALLQSCVHLCDLLTRSGSVTDFNLPLTSSSSSSSSTTAAAKLNDKNNNSETVVQMNETTMTLYNESNMLTAVQEISSSSFLEEISLHLLEELQEFEYPVELIQGYAATNCPSQGHAFTTALLSKRYVYSDKECMNISKILESYTIINSLLDTSSSNATSAVSEAEREKQGRQQATALGLMYQDIPAVVPLINRAIYWYKQGDRRGIIRALCFYQLAGDQGRSEAIIDYSIWSLCCATRCCQRLFPALVFYPEQPGQPWRLPVKTHHHNHHAVPDTTTTADTSDSSAMYEHYRSMFSLTDLSVYFNKKYWPSHYVGSEEWSSKHNPPTAAMNTSTNKSTTVKSTAATATATAAVRVECEQAEFESILSFSQDILNSLKPSPSATTTADSTNSNNHSNNTGSCSGTVNVLTSTRYTKAVTLVYKAVGFLAELKQMHYRKFNKKANRQQSSTHESAAAADSSLYMDTTTHNDSNNDDHDNDNGSDNKDEDDMIVMLELCVVIMDSYQIAGNLMYELLVSHSVSMRYWLPLLDLCVWTDQQARSSLEYIKKLNIILKPQSVTFGSSLVNSAAARGGGGGGGGGGGDNQSLLNSFAIGNVTAKQSSYMHLQSRLADHGTCIYNKLQAYALSNALTQLELSYNREHFLYYVTYDDLKNLKLKLVGILSASIIQENADVGRKAMQKTNDEYQQQQMQMQSSKNQSRQHSSKKSPMYGVEDNMNDLYTMRQDEVFTFDC